MLKTVSIIVPVYNTGRLIEKCLESLINQTYKDIEIIIVDDGSNDNSKEFCIKYINKDKRIKYFYKENGGISSARNYGIEKSSGDYIIFVDSDDYIDKCVVENLLNTSREDRLTCIGFIIENEEGNNKKFLDYYNKIQSNQEYIINVLLSKAYSYSCGILFQRKILIEYKIKFNEDIKYIEDMPFVLNYAKYVEDIYYIEQGYYHYIQRENSITSNKNKLKNNIINIDKILDIIEDNINTLNINKLHTLIINKKMKLIEKEISKSCILDNIFDILKDKDLKNIFEKLYFDNEIVIFFKLYLFMLLKNMKFTFKIYINVRKILKKAKGVIKNGFKHNNSSI